MLGGQSVNKEIRAEQGNKLRNAQISELIADRYLNGYSSEDEIVEVGLSGVDINPRFLWGIKRCIRGLQSELGIESPM